MARVKFKNEWFYPVSDNAFFETELETLVVQNSGLLKEGTFVLPFKATVTAPGLPPKQPDLALIDPLYRYWWVIEVELVGHSLQGHVIPQIQTFVEGVYGEAHVAALMKQSASLDSEKLSVMMQGEPPAVVVISNRLDPIWDDSLRKSGAYLAALNVFRSTEHRDVFVLDGSLPDTPLDYLTRIAPTKIDRMFKVLSPATLTGRGSDTIDIQVDDRLTTWTKMPTANDCFIFSPVEVELYPNVSYAIYEDDAGSLSLREWRE